MLNIKKPAHSSIVPEGTTWDELTNFQLSVLSKHIDLNDSIKVKKKLVEPRSEVTGYYKYQGESDYFIKIVSKKDNKVQFMAEDISAWLLNSGVSVGQIKNGYPKEVEEINCWIYIYPYLKHNFIFRNENEIYFIGKEVGNMHKMMCKYPRTDDVFIDGNKKNNLLIHQFENIKKYKVSSLPEEATWLIKNFSKKEYNLINKNAQMIHGDLNMGNVIFTENNLRPFLIDFEDATTSWMNPIYDLAFLIQRFVLADPSGREIYIPLIKGYKESYSINIDAGELYSMIKIISIRSLLILSTLNSIDVFKYKDEINKFIDLYKSASINYVDICKIEKFLIKNSL